MTLRTSWRPLLWGLRSGENANAVSSLIHPCSWLFRSIGPCLCDVLCYASMAVCRWAYASSWVSQLLYADFLFPGIQLLSARAW